MMSDKEIGRMSEEEELLREALTFIKAGDIIIGRQKLIQILSLNRMNSSAWLWLSAIVDNDAQRYDCLQNVLRINPQHSAARRGLEALTARMERQVKVASLPPVFKQKKNSKTTMNVIAGLCIGGGLGLLACVLIIYYWLNYSSYRPGLLKLTALGQNSTEAPLAIASPARPLMTDSAPVIQEDWPAGQDSSGAMAFRFPPQWSLIEQNPGVIVLAPAAGESIRLQVIDQPFPYDRTDVNTGATQFCQDRLQAGESSRSLLSQGLWPYASGGYMCYFTSPGSTASETMHEIQLISPLGDQRFALVTMQRPGSKAPGEELQQLEGVLTSLR
jgi:hypothetical protein